MRFIIATAFAWMAGCGLVSAEDCAHDPAAMLALNVRTFDQDRTTGWRSLADREGCKAAAADLIAAYRDANAGSLSQQEQRSLRWHEGQMRAAAGQTEAAISLFETTRRGGMGPYDRVMDLYLDATLAFLRRDRTALEQARADLVAVPQPDSFAAAVERTRTMYGDEAANAMRWPSNLDFVDGFLTCFDRPYSEAYSSDECLPPLQ